MAAGYRQLQAPSVMNNVNSSGAVEFIQYKTIQYFSLARPLHGKPERDGLGMLLPSAGNWQLCNLRDGKGLGSELTKTGNPERRAHNGKELRSELATAAARARMVIASCNMCELIIGRAGNGT